MIVRQNNACCIPTKHLTEHRTVVHLHGGRISLRQRLDGEQTAAAVSQFQRVSGLPVTAVTDHETWNRIVDAFTRQSPSVLPAAPLSIVWQPKQVIRPGEKNSHLYLIQSMLLAVSKIYPAMPAAQVTGEHDAASVAATNWLQERSGLPTGGVIDQTTWLYLGKLYRISIGDGTEGGSGSAPG